MGKTTKKQIHFRVLGIPGLAAQPLGIQYCFILAGSHSLQGWRLRLAMSRVPGEPLEEFLSAWRRNGASMAQVFLYRLGRRHGPLQRGHHGPLGTTRDRLEQLGPPQN